MDSVRIKSYAKLNLSLDITGRADGYHLLDSVVTTIDIADIITLKKRKKDNLVTIAMHGMNSEGIPFEDNNAVKAAQYFIDVFGTNGVDITVYKNIPMGAGLGGSSADVAGVLNGLKKMYGIDDDVKIKELADKTGSDCGYMLTGGYARLKGRGEIVEFIDSDLKLNFLLLLPSEPVSTSLCYKTYDKINCKQPPSSDEAYAALNSGNVFKLGKALSNSLLPAAYNLNPDVGQAIIQLKEFAPLGVTMTGSGSCVYALFENDQYRNYALSRYRGKFRAIATKTIKGGAVWQKND